MASLCPGPGRDIPPQKWNNYVNIIYKEKSDETIIRNYR